MKKFNLHYIAPVFFLCVVIGGMFLAVYSFAYNQMKKLNKDEKYARTIKINWEKLYPFEIDIEEQTPKPKKENIFDYIKKKCEDYSSKNLFGYYDLVECAKQYDDAVGWNINYVRDYNAVVKLHDEHLTTYTESKDISDNARSTIALAEFCRKNGIEFFYANLPTKICISEDKNISGTLDFANQNADRFLAMLNENGVKAYDFRKLLHDDGMKHHESFYVTDHHWKAETGLWAARHILRILRDDYNFDVDPDILSPDRFDYVIYPEWFLGSHGKKVTLVRTKPDDFTMIYPKFQTSIQYKIPSLKLDLSGDITVAYDMTQVESKDYYHKNPYACYSYGDKPLNESENNLILNGKKILIVHDSYSDSVLPFVSIGTQCVYAIDMRHFSGSIRSFIMQKKPDVMIVAYNSTVPGRDPDVTPGNRFYDFR